MSVKIWTAYKLRRADYLWPLVHDIRLRATLEVKKALRAFYQDHIPNVKTDTDLFKKRLEVYLKNHPPEEAEYLTRLAITRDVFRRCYRFNTTRSERSPYNFDVSVGFRQYRGGVYVIPYSDWMMRDVLNFLKRDRRLRDYHYQNQVDKPNHISERRWKERQRVWDGMDTAGQWQDVLVLDICKWDMWYQVDPWLDLGRERKKVCPSKSDSPGKASET